MIRRRVVVSGHVQGVWFRDSCQREAATRGVAGWVRNLPEGSVEAVFEGDDEAVAALLRWCEVGPPQAIVAHVQVIDEDPTGEEAFDVVG